ncbi:hypothetical protein D3C87_2136590 [compost metagenome]
MLSPMPEPSSERTIVIAAAATAPAMIAPQLTAESEDSMVVPDGTVETGIVIAPPIGRRGRVG